VMEKKRLFLIDAPGFYYRAFYGLKGNLRSAKGEPTNAVYGFVKMMGKIIREEKPDAVAIALDSKEKTFRHEMYPKYKESRMKMPEELSVQLPYIEKLIEAFRIPILKESGLEADDLLGFAAHKGVEEGYNVVIVSGDKDLMQLVGGNITMFDPIKEKYIDSEGVKEKFGVEPGKVIEFLGLSGDSSDDIPGVPGIGPKTALKLLEKYGDIDTILANVEEIDKPKLKQSLIDNADNARLSRKLATIKVDLEIKLDIESLKLGEPDVETLNSLYRELGFKSLIEETKTAPRTEVKTEYKTVLAEEDLDAMIKRLREAGGFAVDTETTSVEPMRAELVGLSFSCSEGEGYYVPIGHDYMDVPKQIPKDVVISKLRPILEDASLEKCGQNIKYDMIVLAREGIHLASVSFDTMIASYLLNAEERRHNLSFLSEKYLGHAMIEYEDVAGKGAKEISFKMVEVEKAAHYSAEDADITWRLSGILKPELKREGLEKLYYEIEIPVIGILARMEMNGIAISEERLKAYSVELDRKLQELEKKIYDAAGEEFNIASPKQLGVILFEKLGLSKVRKTKTGISTDQKTLEALAGEHPLPDLLLEYRMLAKLKSTYVDPLPQLVQSDTGRIHTSFNQAMAATGRLSSSSPNLQNIPVRSEEGRKIREAFHGGEGMLLISADYSQIELRLLAHLSGDRLLVESFQRDEDVHARTAKEIFGALAGESEEMRRIAKAVNFSIIYGKTAFGLARDLRIPRGEASTYINDYFSRYAGVRDFIEKVKGDARRDGFVKTMYGRVRYFPDINSSNRTVREMAERMAVNTVVQGSAADLMKKAMIAVDAALKGSGARMLLQVHDELIMEAPEADMKSVMETVRPAMESAGKLDVPLKVQVSFADNWGSLH